MEIYPEHPVEGYVQCTKEIVNSLPKDTVYRYFSKHTKSKKSAAFLFHSWGRQIPAEEGGEFDFEKGATVLLMYIIQPKHKGDKSVKPEWMPCFRMYVSEDVYNEHRSMPIW